MKKVIIIFCVVLVAFGFKGWNNSETDKVETLHSKDLAIMTPLSGKFNKSSFSSFNCNTGSRQLGKSGYNPFLTVVPVKQAEYEGGMDALMAYLKENSKENWAGVELDKLQAAKLFFTVTKKGTIENVRLDGTTSYISIDNAIIELITKAPGKWKPAENAKGEKVDQELELQLEKIVMFGSKGC